jgi:hypothetical protein
MTMTMIRETWQSLPMVGEMGETSCSQILKTLDSSQSLLSLWAVLEMTVAHKEKEYLSGCDFF